MLILNDWSGRKITGEKTYEQTKLKYVSKICGLNFETVAVTRLCIRFLSFR